MNKVKIFALCILLSAHCHAEEIDEEKLYGVYEGADTAARAIYGTVIISEGRISWGGDQPKNPTCHGAYEIVEKFISDKYPGMSGGSRPDKLYTIFNLKLKEMNCNSNVGSLLLAIPSNAKGRFAWVVEYGKDGRVNGHMSFGEGHIEPEEDK